MAVAGASRSEEVVRQVAAHPWTGRLTRLGYAARGVLYVTMGLLAAQVALGGGGGGGGRRLDQEGAIAALADRPLGGAVLAVMMVGLAAYGAWGFARALLDVLGKGHDLKGLSHRFAYLVSAATYTLLLFPAGRILWGAGAKETQERGDTTASAAEWILARPLGSALVAVVGAWLVGVAATQLFEAWSGRFEKELERGRMSGTAVRWTMVTGRVGYAARGVMFGLIGFYLLASAVTAGAVKAKGPDAALQHLAALPLGPALLALVGLGLASFGLHSILCARWVRVGDGAKGAGGSGGARGAGKDGEHSLPKALAWAAGSIALLLGLLSFAGWAGREVAAGGAWLEADRAVYRALNGGIDGPHVGALFIALNHPGLDYLVIAALVVGYCAWRRPDALAVAAASIGVALTVNMVATWEVQRTPPRERPYLHDGGARTPLQSCDGPFLVGSRAPGDEVVECGEPPAAGRARGVDWGGVWAQYPSFPSGHMRESAALAVLLGAFWPGARAFAVGLVILMGYTRVLFGAHYPTDVLGGTVMGVWSGTVTLCALKGARGLVGRLAQVPRVRRSWDYVARERREGRPDLDPLPARVARVALALVGVHALLVVVGIAGGNAWAENVLELLNDTQAWVRARLPIKPASIAPAVLLALSVAMAGWAACRRNGRWGVPTRTALMALGTAALLTGELLWLGGTLFGGAEQEAAGGPRSPFPDPFPMFAAALVSAMAVRSKRLAVSGQGLAVLAAAAGVLAGTATIHAALAGYLLGAAAGPLAHQMVSQWVAPRDAGDERGATGATGVPEGEDVTVAEKEYRLGGAAA